MARHRYMRRTNKRGQFHFREETATSFSFLVYSFHFSRRKRLKPKSKQNKTGHDMSAHMWGGGREGEAGQDEAGAQCGLWLRWLRFASSRIAEQQTKTSQRRRRAGAEENREKDSGSRDTVPTARSWYPVPAARCPVPGPGILDSGIILPHEKLIKGFTVYGECQANSHVLLPASGRCSGNSRTTPLLPLATASAQSGTWPGRTPRRMRHPRRAALISCGHR